jgi:hypothetical protein
MSDLFVKLALTMHPRGVLLREGLRVVRSVCQRLAAPGSASADSACCYT